MSSKRRQALGRGLTALLGSSAVPENPVGVPQPENVVQINEPQTSLLMIPVEGIRPNRHQPRQDFDSETLEELSNSIKQAGLIQPLVVRRSDDGYELVAGERRWRAAKLAGMTEVPCVITEATDKLSLLIALVENIQREDLNPMDEAEAYAHLREEFGLSQEGVAEKVGKSRVAVANSLRLLNLSPEMQEDVRDGSITAGHARALLGIPDPAMRKKLWSEIKSQKLSVREAEERCRSMGGMRPRQTSAFTGRPRGRRAAQADTLAEELMAQLGCKVKIRRRGTTSGCVELHFSDLEEFERIMDALGHPASGRL